jgi:hypothetical protein
MDLVKKKSIAIRPETYARLTRLAAELKLKREDGGMVSLDMAVVVLLDGWKELERIATSNDIPVITSENIVDSGRVVTGFLEQYFGDENLGL